MGTVYTVTTIQGNVVTHGQRLGGDGDIGEP